MTETIANPDLTKKEQEARIGRNMVSDTGGQFELGNVPVLLQDSFHAATPSILVTLVAFGARFEHERRQTGYEIEGASELWSSFKGVLANSPITNNIITNNAVTRAAGSKATQIFNEMVVNPNVGLEVSASGLAMASLSVAVPELAEHGTEALTHLYHWGNAETISATFAACNFMNGFSSRLENPQIQKAMRAGATIISNTGIVMTAGDLDLVKGLATLNPEAYTDPNALVYGVLGLAAGQGVYQTIADKPTKGWLQPQLLMAAGCVVNAANHFMAAASANGAMEVIHTHLSTGVANSCWALALVALDASFKNGGFDQKYFNRKPSRVPKKQQTLPESNLEGPEVV